MTGAVFSKEKLLQVRERLPRPLRNVVSNWTGSLVSMVIAFFLSPFVVHRLGTTAYGIWVLLMSLTNYLGLLDLGVRGAVTCFIAKLHIQGKHDEASRLVSSALAIFTLLGAAALAACLVGAFVASRLFHIRVNHLGVLLVLAGASIASALIGNVFGAILVGLQRFELSNSIEIILSILKAVAILVVLGNGQGLVGLAAVQLAFSILTTIIYALASRRLYPQLSVRYILSDKANARLIFSFGSQLFLLNASAYLIFYTDSLVIGSFLPVAMVTFFAIAGNLINYSRSLLSGISETFTPLASSLEAEGNWQELERIALAGARYATMLVLPIVITLVLRGKTFIGLWMGSEYAQSSGRVLQILCISLFFSAASQVATSMMVGINKLRPLVVLNIVEGIMNLVLSIVLVHKMGIVGVAWGTAIPRMVTCVIFWPLYMRRTFGIHYGMYALSTWVRPTVAAIPFVFVSLLIERLWYAHTLSIFAFQVLLTLPVPLVVFWFGCLSRVERSSFLGRVYPPVVGEAAS